jgi:hypothetical protein
MRNCFLVVAVLALAPCAYAQRSGPGSNPQVALQPFTRVNIIESETVKGAPYSAEVVNESVQVLPDGNRIVHRSTSRVYRDSEGRTRRESDTPSGVVEINISDPMLGKSWGLNPDRRIAIERPRPAMLNGNVNLNGQLEHLTVMLNGQIASFVARGGNGYSFATGQNSETSAEEKLTPKVIEGLRVEGLRRTTTIPAGAIGNERAIVVTSDQWTSPDLKVLVLSESSDPRTGTSTYKLVNVKRGDAPASLFQVPADYTVQTGPIVGRGGRQ